MIALGSDHGGFALKQQIMEYLDSHGLEYKDFGTQGTESCDYPVYAREAAQAVASGKCSRGIVVCTTGIGVSMVANRVRGVRCALCTDSLMAEMTRRHNDANMLALGAGIVGATLAERIVETFLTTGFEGGRHARRVAMIDEIAPDK